MAEAYLDRWTERFGGIVSDVFRERSRLSVSEWAERHRVLAKGQYKGQIWTNEVTPYLVEIMDTVSDPHRPRKAVVMKSTRVGYTEGVIGNCVGYLIDQMPSDMIVMHPSDEEAQAYSKEHLDPLFEGTPCLRERLHLDAYKDGRNTIAYKAFAGGSLAIIGPKTSSLRRRSARFAFSDEIDELDEVNEQGDPLLRLDKRLDDFDDSLHFRGSTPTVKHKSRIYREYQASDRRRYFVPCPHCDEVQLLEWGGKDHSHGITWDKEVFCRGCGAEAEYGGGCDACGGEDLDVRHLPETAHYVCVTGCRIEESEKAAMVGAGSWIPTNPEGHYPGWHIHALLSSFPGAGWAKIVGEFLAAKGDPDALTVFVNTVLGEAWDEPDYKKVTPEGLLARAEVYPAEVPRGVGVLTAGVDVQGDRIEVLVRGYGVAYESWDILHERIWGDPTKAATWGRVDYVLARKFLHEGGADMRIMATMIDSGFKADEVYDFVRPRESRNVWASKGDSGLEGAPPLRRPSRANSAKVKLWTIGTHTLKDALIGRLAVEVPGPRYTHLRQMDSDICNGFDAEYFAQFGGEKKVRERVKGSLQWRWRWVKVRERNEFIDLQVLADAALRALGPGVYENLAEWVGAVAERGATVPEPEEDKPPPPESDEDDWASGGKWGRSW